MKMKKNPPSRLKDITGQRFGRLTVIEQAESKNNHARWVCKCDCGNKRIVYGSSLFSGETKSCGCWNKDKMLKHNLTDTKLAHIWSQIKQRCFQKNCKAYKNYGGRGITVCDEWKNDFLTFYNWSIKNGYKENLSIDRIDNDGNYCPENCRWVEDDTQRRNKRTNIKIGTFCLKDICVYLNISYKAVWARLSRGKNLLEALYPINWKTMGKKEKEHFVNYRKYLLDYVTTQDVFHNMPQKIEEWSK